MYESLVKYLTEIRQDYKFDWFEVNSITINPQNGTGNVMVEANNNKRNLRKECTSYFRLWQKVKVRLMIAIENFI